MAKPGFYILDIECAHTAAAGGTFTIHIPTGESKMQSVKEEGLAEVVRLMNTSYKNGGGKIPAIKKLRDITGLGLKESKEAVEITPLSVETLAPWLLSQYGIFVERTELGLVEGDLYWLKRGRFPMIYVREEHGQYCFQSINSPNTWDIQANKDSILALCRKPQEKA